MPTGARTTDCRSCGSMHPTRRTVTRSCDLFPNQVPLFNQSRRFQLVSPIHPPPHARPFPPTRSRSHVVPCPSTPRPSSSRRVPRFTLPLRLASQSRHTSKAAISPYAPLFLTASPCSAASHTSSCGSGSRPRCCCHTRQPRPSQLLSGVVGVGGLIFIMSTEQITYAAMRQQHGMSIT